MTFQDAESSRVLTFMLPGSEDPETFHLPGSDTPMKEEQWSFWINSRKVRRSEADMHFQQKFTVTRDEESDCDAKVTITAYDLLFPCIVNDKMIFGSKITVDTSRFSKESIHIPFVFKPWPVEKVTPREFEYRCDGIYVKIKREGDRQDYFSKPLEESGSGVLPVHHGNIDLSTSLPNHVTFTVPPLKANDAEAFSLINLEI